MFYLRFLRSVASGPMTDVYRTIKGVTVKRVGPILSVKESPVLFCIVLDTVFKRIL